MAMSKKEKGKEKVQERQVPPRETPKPAKKEEVDERNDAPDFGGIPNRDLKKNLGCG